MTTPDNPGLENFRAFTSWLFSCLLALTLIVLAFGVMYPAYGAPSEDDIRDFSESYYQAVAANDEAAIYQHFSGEAWFKFTMDFGAMYPDYEVEFRADNEEAFDSSIFEGYEVTGTDFSIESVELNEAGAVVKAVLRQPYTWSGFEGTMEAQETLTIDASQGVFQIMRLDSAQAYR